MIDGKTIDSNYSEIEAIQIKKAIALLSVTGVLEKQISEEGIRVLAGNSDEPIEEIAESVRKYRTKVGLLGDLHQLGLDYAKEF